MAAKRGGAVAVGVYDKSAEDYIEEIKRDADGYIYSFSELI